ncbi:MAG TPA: SpoIIE family protein phosphatase [Leptospiraceae bacterium]|nr:SpoIIE family protein phosphatase [Leptospiraceae bacterium]
MTATLESERSERRTNLRPVFSAYELGKICIHARTLAQVTGSDFVSETTPVVELYDLLSANPDLDFLPLTGPDGDVSGYIRRQMFFAKLSQTRFSRELLLRQDVRAHSIMERRVICLDARTYLSEASEALMARDEEIRFDPFVVTYEGKFFGTATVQRVLEGINHFLKLDLEACARMQDQILQPLERGFEITSDNHRIVMPLIAPGGDYAELIEINDRYSLGLLFDVCGKGLKASSMVNTFASVIKTLIYKMDAEGSDLPRILLALHNSNQLLTQLTCQEMYATGVAIILDKEKNVISVLDYGHGYVWLKRGSSVHRLSAHIKHAMAVPFLGIHDDLQMPAGHFLVQNNDVIFACSDGLIEQKNDQREDYGVQRLRNLLRRVSPESPRQINEMILEDFNMHIAGSRRSDDLCMLCIRVVV